MTHARIDVHVQPRASRNAIAGMKDGALRIAVTAPPVDGEANAAVVALLAKKLGVPKRDVSVVQGETSRHKVIEVVGLAREDVLLRLAE